jgi:hypothetical protein
MRDMTTERGYLVALRARCTPSGRTGQTDGMVDPVRSPRLSDGRFRLLIAAMIAAAFVALYVGVRATDTGDDDPVTVNGRPDVVEHLVPRAGDEVLRQAELGIDLAPGYEGALVVNGVEIPTDELRLVPEQNQVFFTPGDGKVVERLLAGPNCATAIVWKASVGRGTADDTSFSWCFEAL